MRFRSEPDVSPRVRRAIANEDHVARERIQTKSKAPGIPQAIANTRMKLSIGGSSLPRLNRASLNDAAPKPAPNGRDGITVVIKLVQFSNRICRLSSSAGFNVPRCV